MAMHFAKSFTAFVAKSFMLTHILIVYAKLAPFQQRF
jgi:hypothetical protein